MAQTPKCIKCGHTTFEMTELNVRDADWKYLSIQCSSCGAMHAVTEYYNIGYLIHQLAKKLGFPLN